MVKILQARSWDLVHVSTFALTFGSLSPTVTLKIKLRSPKPNQLNHDGQMLYPACTFWKKNHILLKFIMETKSVTPMPKGFVQK